MLSHLSFLLGVWMITVTLSYELPERKAASPEGLEESLLQLIAKVSAAERDRGIMKDRAGNQDNMWQNEKSRKTVPNVVDRGITRVDIPDESGQTVELRYQDCNQRKELIVIKPGTKEEMCLLHDMDNTLYASECEKTGERVKHKYKITGEVKDRTFLKENGIPQCQDENVPLWSVMDEGDHLPSSEMSSRVTGKRQCSTYCCGVGWWGRCKSYCFNC